MSLPITSPTSLSGSKSNPSFKRNSNFRSSSWVYYLSLISLGLLWVIWTFHVFYRLPVPVPAKDATTTLFSEELARKHIHHLSVTIGQRIVGTSQELETIQYLLSVLHGIQKDPKTLQPFDIHVEAGFGQHLFEIIRIPIIKTYFNVTNIVVRFPCKTCFSDRSVLVNSHFDTIPGSNGAADAGTPIAVMLESVRMLAQHSAPLRNSIVFLFNGAEETLQDASHAFITKSDLFKNVAGVINLEAGGVGGKAMLFQAKNEMMLKIYSHTSYPHGSSLANDLFRTGSLMSDTDYIQFMNHGHLNSGLDIAFYSNSYFYHTRFDIEKNLPPGSVQHMGQNTIDMLHYIAQSDSIEKLSLPASPFGYFDFLGYVFVSYSIRKAELFYQLIILIGCIHLFLKSKPKKLVRSFGILLKSLFYSLFFPFILACFLHISNLSLLWYSNSILAIFLYLPSMLMGHIYARSSTASSVSNSFQLELYEKHAQVLFLILELLTLAYFEVTGIFFLVVHISSLLLTHYLLPSAFFYHIQFLLPFCFHLPILGTVMKVIVPLTGRSGSTTPAELIIPLVIWLFSIHIFFLFTPLLYRLRGSLLFRYCGYFTFSFLLFLYLAVPKFTPLAPQRLILFHHDDPVFNISELHIAKVSSTPFPKHLVAGLDAWLGPHHSHTASKRFDQLLGLFPFSILVESLHWDMSLHHADLDAYMKHHLPRTQFTVLQHAHGKEVIFDCHLNAHNMLTLFKFQAPVVLNSSVPIRPYFNHTYVLRQTAGSESALHPHPFDCNFHITIPSDHRMHVLVAGIPRDLGRVKHIMKKIASMIHPNTDLLTLNAIVTNFTV